jgi:hypothetical protein
MCFGSVVLFAKVSYTAHSLTRADQKEIAGYIDK